MYFHFTWMLVSIPGVLLSLWAQARVKSTFAKYAQVAVRSGMTGAEAAAAVARAGGANNVTIERHAGFLSDHYDPRAKALRLSPDVYDGRSISSIAVAAHEAGHSIQDATGYSMLGFRSMMVPVTSIGARFWMLPFIIGLAINMSGLILVGIVLFTATVAFQLVTLPVEFDASNRAKAVLASSGIVSTPEEAEGVEKVLGAAAMTYVAAAAASVMQLMFLIFRFMQSRDRG